MDKERAVLFINLANKTAKELLRLRPNLDELHLFFRRLQIVDATIKYPNCYEEKEKAVAGTTAKENRK